MKISTNFGIFSTVLLVLTSRINCLLHSGLGSRDEANLVKNLFNGSVPYNPLIRPALKISDVIKVSLGLSFIQLISVQWRDFQLVWNVSDYGGIEIIRMIPDMVWQPDIVLFNNADGNYEVSYKSRVLITHDGLVQYIPPAIYRSSCRIDVKYFPFDQQSCELKFGSWTFNADQVQLEFMNNFQYVDLSDYVISGTWDVIDCPGVIRRYRGSHSTPNRTRIDYKIVLRRKTLFYTVNLIIPCVLISLLSICVFYLPADEGEKMTLSISILLALVVFLLLLQKILPPTSTSIPLIASYLLFTMILNVFSILITVIIINCSFRTPRTHTMPQWVYTFFIERLSRILLMSHRPNQQDVAELATSHVTGETFRELEDNLEYLIQTTEYNSSSLKINPQSSPLNKFTKKAMPNNKKYCQKKKRVTYQDLFLKNKLAEDDVITENGSDIFSGLSSPVGKRRWSRTEIHNNRCYSSTSSTPLIDKTASSGGDPFKYTSNRSGSIDSNENIWVSFEDQLEQLLGAGGGREVAITQELYKSIKAVRYIARHIRQSDAHDAVLKDWKYIGLVMDRLLLVIFLIVTISGTLGIFMVSPHIFDFVDQQEVINRLARAKAAKESHIG